MYKLVKICVLLVSLIGLGTWGGSAAAAPPAWQASGAITTDDQWEIVGTPSTSTAGAHVLNGITTLTAESLIVASTRGENNSAAGGATFGATDPESLAKA